MSATLSIPIPKMLQGRKRWRGFPVPFVNLLDKDRQPDFRAIDEGKRLTCMRQRLCQLCGRKLKWMIFFGGPNAARGELYFEPGMHLDCALYALQVCPYIIGRAEKAEVADVQKRHVGTGIIVVRDETNPMQVPDPGKWVLTLANGYTRRPNGTSPCIHFHPVPIWWKSEILHPPTMNAADWQGIRAEILKQVKEHAYA